MKTLDYKKLLFISLLGVSFFVNSALALALGIIYALFLGSQYPKLSKKASSYLLKIAVIGLGFSMSLSQVLKSGKEGLTITIASVTLIMLCGVLIGRFLKIDKKTSYLISTGTAICGGSAIVAISPVIKSDDDQTSVSLATIFSLNAIALFLFPFLGHLFDLTQEQFGLWCAIAIHDTSSVVGAGAAFGEEALKIATTVKLTRVIWIVPLAIVSAIIFKRKDAKINPPYFILLFIAAILINTYYTIPLSISLLINNLSHKILSSSLFLIGSGLSLDAMKRVGTKPMFLGLILWFATSLFSFFLIKG